ncbi:hypothetical protein BKK56_11680 [Rodentibacter genomosp. 2]|uniref:hypothetical protein n=1 Tax=Rodentibacter genomosp. 2 TaxID=1908266 RepID=UPI00098644CF|nr:hypothetical protein BKK56_11680 [Rodentibacter genomosp. 2]
MKGFERKNDSSILGFVVLCNSMKAINFEEFKEFLYLLIKNTVEELPAFIWDLIDLEERNLSDIYQVIGFVPSSNLNDSERSAIYGITIKRFGSFFDMPISKNKALKALNENIQVLERFKNTFPFIKLDF